MVDENLTKVPIPHTSHLRRVRQVLSWSRTVEQCRVKGYPWRRRDNSRFVGKQEVTRDGLPHAPERCRPDIRILKQAKAEYAKLQ
jgi:hypothetical protein